MSDEGLLEKSFNFNRIKILPSLEEKSAQNPVDRFVDPGFFKFIDP